MNDPVSANAMPVSEVDPVVRSGGELTRTQRWISLAEFVVGGAIVVSHNGFLLIPNGVPILCVLCLTSLRVRDTAWGAIGDGGAGAGRGIVAVRTEPVGLYPRARVH